MEYYHGTDLFSVKSILRDGIKCGYDGYIWVYDKLSLTATVMLMLDCRKTLHQMAVSLGCEPIMWQTTMRKGFGIFQIDSRGITGILSDYSCGNKHLLAFKQNRIEPNFIKFIGAYNDKTLLIEPIDITTLNDITQKPSKGDFLNF